MNDFEITMTSTAGASMILNVIQYVRYRGLKIVIKELHEEVKQIKANQEALAKKYG